MLILVFHWYFYELILFIYDLFLDTAIGSPTKSTSSAEGTVDETEHTSREVYYYYVRLHHLINTDKFVEYLKKKVHSPVSKQNRNIVMNKANEISCR